jgi:hypothetical protein
LIPFAINGGGEIGHKDVGARGEPKDTPLSGSRVESAVVEGMLAFGKSNRVSA